MSKLHKCPHCGRFTDLVVYKIAQYLMENTPTHFRQIAKDLGFSASRVRYALRQMRALWVLGTKTVKLDTGDNVLIYGYKQSKASLPPVVRQAVYGNKR